MLKNGTKMAPKRVPKCAPEGRPRLPKGHIGALHGPAGSRGLPRLLRKAFVSCWFWCCSCLCFWFWFFMCVVVFSFGRSCCLSLCVLVFWLCVLFPVVVILFYSFVFAMFEECLAVSGATSKRHATCSSMALSGLVEMLIRLEYVGSAPVVMVPL